MEPGHLIALWNAAQLELDMKAGLVKKKLVPTTDETVAAVYRMHRGGEAA